MNAICLVLDRLHAGYLGPYGNSWIETPAFNRLAGQALSFDHALVDSPELERLYRSYWQGWHSLCQDEPPDDRSSLPALLRNAGVHTALLTDDRAVAEHSLAMDFDELIRLDPPWESKGAEQIEQTHLAKCCVEAIDWLGSAPEPFLLWCHLAGLGTVWDAPPEFRQAYWEEGDPPPLTSADVPESMLPEDHDPDELLNVCHAYAGQVSLLDTCLGALLEFVDSTAFAAQTLLALTSARGFPLGEHRRVGPCNTALYVELVHVPLMLRLPNALAAAARSQVLVEPADLWATLLERFGVSDRPPSPTALSLLPVIRQEAPTWRDRLCIAGAGTDRAIRTPAWYLRSAAASELYTKPDDRWEVNDVSDRCRQVVRPLEEALQLFEQALQSGTVRDLPPLEEVLLSGLE